MKRVPVTRALAVVVCCVVAVFFIVRKHESTSNEVPVWVNTESGIYHCQGSAAFGTTARGQAMSEEEATSQGYRPARDIGCAERRQSEEVASCGLERWPVKVLLDDDVDRVNLMPRRVAVSDLIAIDRPFAQLHRRRRQAPVELETFVVQAVVLGISMEDDSDYHVILGDPSKPLMTLIGEIPAPECAVGSRFAEHYRDARKAIQQVALGSRVEVAGVGFFDDEHRQTGQAPNNFELHPVLSVRVVADRH